MSVRGFGPLRTWLGVFFLGCLWPAALQAGTVGDPIPNEEPGSFRVSLEYDETKRKVTSGDPRFNGNLLSDRLFVRSAYVPFAGVELFVLLGGGDAETDNRLFQGDTGFAYGLGTRIRLLRWGELQFASGLQWVQLFSSDGDALWSDLELYEIDADLVASLVGLEFFRPYAGVRAGFAEAKLSGQGVKHVSADEFVGLVIGGEFQVWEGLWFGAEGRLIHESSIGVRVGLRF